MNTDISSRTPEGFPNRCPVCANDVYIAPSEPTGDAPCPHCGALLWFFETERGRILVEKPKPTIRQLVDDIVRLARSDVFQQEFFDTFILHLVTALDAEAGAVWTTDDGDRSELTSQLNFAKAKLAGNPLAKQQHAKLLGWVQATGQPLAIDPQYANTKDRIGKGAANPTEFLLIVHPIIVEHQITGIVEVFQRAGARSTAQRGYQRFLGQMCEIAGDYLAAQS